MGGRPLSRARTADGLPVVVVGGGPAGLSLATTLRARDGRAVIVVEREVDAGGIPRHTNHLGYGIRDLHRVTTGPRYAAALVGRALDAGVVIRTSTTVLDATGDGVTLATGEQITAAAVVLATGVRERPRSARLVPGDRPAGVLTTGTVQQLTALQHRRVGTLAVVVGAEHVSCSAILSLHHGGCRTVALVTPLPRHQTYAPLWLATAGLRRVPLLTGVDVAEIVGRRRVEAVVLTDGRRVECDTVVFTGDWIPDHEVARRAGVTIDRGSRAPAVTSGFRTSTAGLFAVGNLAHPAETADVCARDGVRAADSVAAWLGGDPWPAAVPPISVDDPVRWAAPVAGGITLRVDTFVRGRLVIRSGGRVVHQGRPRRFVPNRAVHAGVRAEAPLHVSIEPA